MYKSRREHFSSAFFLILFLPQIQVHSTKKAYLMPAYKSRRNITCLTLHLLTQTHWIQAAETTTQQISHSLLNQISDWFSVAIDTVEYYIYSVQR